MEGNGYLVSWCVSHLVELALPEAYDEKYEKWRYSDLPILPSEWKYQISDATRKQFGILKKLMETETSGRGKGNISGCRVYERDRWNDHRAGRNV